MKKPQAQKTYPGDFPRPTVEVIVHDRENIVLAGTPWGSQDALKLLDQTTHEYLSASIGDREATSPFPKLPGLSSTENNLRTALLLSNEAIHQKFNKENYLSSCEAVVIHQNKSEIAWVQVGQPHILLLRDGRIFPLQVCLDLSIDYGNPIPLPSRLIGLERTWDLEVRSLTIAESDSLIFMARSLLPSNIFGAPLSNLPPEQVVQCLFDAAVAEDPRLPFWISLLA